MSDNSQLELFATPQFIDESGSVTLTGVFNLSSKSTSEDLGEIAFHQEDMANWEYCGDFLNIEEQEQVAAQIVNGRNEHTGK